MSFELKRVPLHFDWPLNFPWVGYIETKNPERKRLEPPTGEGFQIWESKEKAAPISPVFKTPEELAQYMTDQSEHIDKNTIYSAWLFFIQHLKDDPDKLNKN